MYYKVKRALKKGYKQLRVNLSAANNPLFIAYYKYLFFPRKNTLNHFLHTYSQSTKPFTVIQVGANDGITHDPIHKYIKRDKWQGVTLEPQPDVYNQYLKKIYHNNEGLETLCAAIGEKDGYQKLYKVAFSKMRWATGLASFERQNLQKAFENGYVKLNCDKYGVEYPSSTEKHITEVSIKA